MSIFDNPNPITSYINEGLTRKQVLEWVYSGKTSKEYIKSLEPEPEPELFKCPKSDKCVMDCYHKYPHKYEEKYCNDLEESGNIGTGNCNVKCVHVLWSDITFFKEDFEIE